MKTAGRAKARPPRVAPKPDTTGQKTPPPTQQELEAAATRVSEKHGEALKRLAKR